MTVGGTGPGNPIRKMLPKVLVVAAAACTVLLALKAAQADRTVAWAAPAAVYLVATIVLMTAPARRTAVHRVLSAIMLLAAIGIGAAFYFVFDRQASALFFGAMFLMFAVIEMQLRPAPKPG